MRALRGLFLLPLCGLLLGGGLFTGCGDDDEDGGGSSLHGVWRYSEMDGTAVLNQETTELLADGSLLSIWADYELQECSSTDGTWSADADSITTTFDTPMGDVTSTAAFELSGNTLTITDPEDGSVTHYTRLAAMVSCDDYNFTPLPGWSGSLSAQVNGTATSFSDVLEVEFAEDGQLLITGVESGRLLALMLPNQNAGTFNVGVDGSAADYTPDLGNPNPYMSTSGIIVLSTVTATHIQGTFTISTETWNGLTAQLSNGVVNINYN